MRVKRWLWRGLGLLFAALALYQLWFYAHIHYWAEQNPTRTAFMRAYLAQGGAGGEPPALQHRWVAYEGISVHVKRAVLAAEDSRFVDHRGFEWEGIQHAARRNLEQGRVVAGGSTVSQQLAKNLFLSNQRTLRRKAQEAVITVMLESALSKQRILEIYLNVIEWGEGIYGIEAAARHYYGVSAAELSPEQSARLAAMVSQPRYYQRRPDSPALQRKTATLQARMELVHVP
jgi:monofunctional glycosyltransferase